MRREYCIDQPEAGIPDVIPSSEAEAGQGGAAGEERGQRARVPHRVTYHTQARPEDGRSETSHI